MLTLTRRFLALVSVAARGAALAAGACAWAATAGAQCNSSFDPLIGAIGTTGTVNAVAVMPNGDVIAGGSFSTMGGVAASNIARWNGAAWNAMGTGTNGVVRCMAVRADGTLAVGGAFSLAGDVAGTASVATWNGSAWVAMGSGVVGEVTALSTGRGGDVVVVTTGTGVRRLRNSVWSSITGSFNNGIKAVAVAPNGDIFVGGTFNTGTSPQNSIARWNGTSWNTDMRPNARGLSIGAVVNALVALPDGGLIVGGAFSVSGVVVTNSNLGRWNGVEWTEWGYGANGPVTALAATPQSYSVVAGEFSNLPGARIGMVLAPSTAASIFPGLGGVPSCVAVAPNGDIIVGGAFTTAGLSVPSIGIARYRFSTPLPVISAHPAPVVTAPTGTASFSVTALSGVGYPGLTSQPGATPIYAWRKNGVAISTALNPTAAMATLVLTNVQEEDLGSYDCLLAALPGCTQTASSAASLSFITMGCQPADIAYDDGSPLPPFGLPGVSSNNGVNEGDYNLFFQMFFNGCP